MTDRALRSAERNKDKSPEEKAKWLTARLRAGEECGTTVTKRTDYVLVENATVLVSKRLFGKLHEVTPESTAMQTDLAARGEWPSGVRVLVSPLLPFETTEHPDPCPHCAGLTLQQRVELAALMGDPGALIAMGYDDLSQDGHVFCCLVCGPNVWCDGPDLIDTKDPKHSLVSEIRKLPQLVQVRASWAAGMACVKTCLHGEEDPLCCSACVAAIRALEDAKAWLDCPCEEHESVWYRESDHLDLSDWLPHPDDSLGDLTYAARYVGEETVSKAICKELVAWTLTK